MTIWEILLIIGCALFVTGVIVATIIRKKRGKGSCDCCSSCSSCPHCAQRTEQNDSRDDNI